jgi:tripartite ATP-independent transporter DctM subunit
MTTPILTAMMMLGAMLIMMALRLPIAAAMAIPGAVGFGLIAGIDPLLNALKGTTVARLSVYELSIIPLFLLMGQLAVKGGLSEALFKAAAAWVGHLRGGLAMASILASAVFGSICGSSVATAATITQVAYPAMQSHGYPNRLSTATLAAGGTLGILIPPSVPLVIYAILAQQNIAKLYLASMIPAALAIVGYLVVLHFSRHDSSQEEAPASSTARRQALKDVWPIAVLFLAIFGGIYAGVFTPTEAAAVGCLLVALLGAVRKGLSIDAIREAILVTAETTAMIFVIFIGADLMNAGLALTQMPMALAGWVTTLTIPPLAILIAVLLLLLILCSVMDELSMMILTIPILLPTILGLDLWGLESQDKAIWFGILVLSVVQFGLIAPPVGLNVILVNGLVKGVPIRETYAGVFPFITADFLRITLLILAPGLALVLL